MSKKKRKNANYHNGSAATVAAPAPKLNRNTIIGIIVAAVVLIGVIVGIVACNAKNDKPLYAEMNIAGYGKIIIELDPSEAPITVENFVDLVEDGFYDGLTIFRAQEGFVIQGGKDDKANLVPIKGEFSENGVNNNISHTRGVISMARTNAPNSATSQFFITLSDSAKYSLDGRYAGFGKVIEGMDVVDAIAEGLFDHAVDSMGFVSDANAITITSIKMIDYKK
jgi:peptidyl-prolyl cis-trans isomerase B (cyclophilin B)